MSPRPSPSGAAAAIVGAAVTGVAVGAALCLRPRRVVVEGQSMAPTLEPGDRLLVLRRRVLSPGDVIALRDPRARDRLLVKRVAALTGDTVNVRGDNQASSTDSRAFGAVDRRDVIGTVVRRYGPPGRHGGLPAPPSRESPTREPRGTIAP
jgi:nickel-type superoxide dismutase maturation protease